MTEQVAEEFEKLVGPMGKTSGAKARVLSLKADGGTKQAAEKPQGWVFLDISAKQGLKPEPLLSAVCGTTKVVPCYKACSCRSFSAACKVPP